MGKKLKRLLVIEDDPNHLADAKSVFGDVEGLDVLYAEDGKQARKAFGVSNFTSLYGLQDIVDGVITDLFFPLAPGEFRVEAVNEGPNGLIIGALCQRAGIPYVICTSGYHHGSKYEWASQMSSAMAGDAPIFVDCDPGRGRDGETNYDGESPHKPWREAYEILKDLVEQQLEAPPVETGS